MSHEEFVTESYWQCPRCMREQTGTAINDGIDGYCVECSLRRLLEAASKECGVQKTENDRLLQQLAFARLALEFYAAINERNPNNKARRALDAMSAVSVQSSAACAAELSNAENTGAECEPPRPFLYRDMNSDNPLVRAESILQAGNRKRGGKLEEALREREEAK